MRAQARASHHHLFLSDRQARSSSETPQQKAALLAPKHRHPGGNPEARRSHILLAMGKNPPDLQKHQWGSHPKATGPWTNRPRLPNAWDSSVLSISRPLCQLSCCGWCKRQGRNISVNKTHRHTCWCAPFPSPSQRAQGSTGGQEGNSPPPHLPFWRLAVALPPGPSRQEAFRGGLSLSTSPSWPWQCPEASHPNSSQGGCALLPFWASLA